MRPSNGYPSSSRPAGSHLSDSRPQSSANLMQAYGSPSGHQNSTLYSNLRHPMLGPDHFVPSSRPAPSNAPQRVPMPSQSRISSSRPPDLSSSNRRYSTQNSIYTGAPPYRPYNGQPQSPVGHAHQPYGRPAMPMSSYSNPTHVTQIATLGHRTASEPHNRQPSQSSAHRPAHQPPHGSTSQGHAPDDCPGCRADLEAVLRASEASALEETRLREQRQREEDEHWRAMRAAEEEEEERRRKQEEDEMRQVMEASQRDEEEAQRRRLEKQREEEEHRRVLFEESRQIGLREDEERIRKAHADLIERSRREAEELAQRKRLEEERLQAMEAAAIEESRREMEEEWKRRDEQEKAMAEFARRGGKQGEAAYWQQVSNEQAYGLALEMDKTLSFNNDGAGSSRQTSRKPLPPTPGAAAFAAGVENRSSHTSHHGKNGLSGNVDESWNHPEDEFMDDDSDGGDPFGDQAEALPTYDEVRTDRPPEAPEDIPEHVRFARPQVIESTHSNAIPVPLVQPEKTPISANATLRVPIRDFGSVEETSTLEGSSRSSPPAPLRAAPRSSSSIPAVVPFAAGSDEPEASEEKVPAVSQQIPPRLDSMIRTTSRSTISSTHSTGEQSISLETPSPTSDFSASRVSLLQQRAMKGTDFGYCQEPFLRSLSLQDGEEDKKHFPPIIQLRDTRSDGSLREGKAYFIVRAYSWKMLLRALAWYGNTRVEAEAEQSSTSLKLRLEVEFVTPTKVDAGLNTSTLHGINNNAHVAICMSLIHSNSTLRPSDAILATALKQSSLALDASYLRRGSTRRVITLPSNAPVLPLTMVRLAQHLHQAHVFSAACPSTSHIALHSPRDLTRAIDKHDFSYLVKVKRLRKEQESAGGESSTQQSNGGQGSTARRNEDEHLHEGEVEAFDEDDSAGTGKMSRVKAKVLRKLVKRSGESNAVDQDLESWITPFDVNQHASS